MAGEKNVVEVVGALVVYYGECWEPSSVESIDAIFSPRLSKSSSRKRRLSTSFRTTKTNSFNIATKSQIIEHEAQSEHECCWLGGSSKWDEVSSKGVKTEGGGKGTKGGGKGIECSGEFIGWVVVGYEEEANSWIGLGEKPK